MNVNDLGNLGQIIGALAAVVSLLYVAHQIWQNTNSDSAGRAPNRIWQRNSSGRNEIAIHLARRGQCPRSLYGRRPAHSNFLD